MVKLINIFDYSYKLSIVKPFACPALSRAAFSVNPTMLMWMW